MRKDSKDPKKTEVLKNFIQYIVTDGQGSADSLFYAKLPATLANQDQKLLSEISNAGQPTQRASASVGK